MVTAHLTHMGEWADCLDSSCELKFHVPDMTATDVRLLPREALQFLLEAVDPPTSVDDDGVKEWRDDDGLLHRDYNLPAVISSDRQRFFKHGKLHRDGGQPAFVGPNGVQNWYVDDKLHRVDGPAQIVPGVVEAWYLNGWKHRDNDQPAVVDADGTSEWYQYGAKHRLHGRPAEVSASGEKYWYWYGTPQLRHEMWMLRLVERFGKAKHRRGLQRRAEMSEL